MFQTPLGSIIVPSGMLSTRSDSMAGRPKSPSHRVDKELALFERLGIACRDVLIGMGATSHYWLSVHAFFLERGFEVTAPAWSTACLLPQYYEHGQPQEKKT